MKGLWQGIRSAFGQPAFVVAVAVLLIAAAGLNGTVQFLQLNFMKQPVPLRLPLDKIPARLGPWIMVSVDQPLVPEIQEVLGTDKYIFREYLDTRALSPADAAAIASLTPEQRRELAGRVMRERPTALVTMAVTYYTGLVDTVAHIPDRCYVADGYQPKSREQESFAALSERPGDGRARFISFQDATASRQSVTRNVAYVFHCNGQYIAEPLDVRVRLQNLRERFGYYAKIELMAVTEDRAEAGRVIDDLLRHALPEIERSLPDFDAYVREQTAADAS